MANFNFPQYQNTGTAWFNNYAGYAAQANAAALPVQPYSPLATLAPQGAQPQQQQQQHSRFDPFIYQQAWFQTQSAYQGYFEMSAQYHAQYQQQLATTGIVSSGYMSAMQNMQDVGISSASHQAFGQGVSTWAGTLGATMMAMPNPYVKGIGAALAIGGGLYGAKSSIDAAQERADAQVRMTQEQVLSQSYALAPIWASMNGESTANTQWRIYHEKDTAAAFAQAENFKMDAWSGGFGFSPEISSRVLKGTRTSQFKGGNPLYAALSAGLTKQLISHDESNFGQGDTIADRLHPFKEGSKTEGVFTPSQGDIDELLLGVDAKTAHENFATLQKLRLTGAGKEDRWRTISVANQRMSQAGLASTVALTGGNVDVDAISEMMRSAGTVNDSSLQDAAEFRADGSRNSPQMRMMANARILEARKNIGIGYDNYLSPYRAYDIQEAGAGERFAQSQAYTGSRSDTMGAIQSGYNRALNASEGAEVTLSNRFITPEQRADATARLLKSQQDMAVALEEGARQTHNYTQNTIDLAQNVVTASLSIAQMTNAGGSSALAATRAQGTIGKDMASTARAEIERRIGNGETLDTMAQTNSGRSLLSQYMQGSQSDIASQMSTASLPTDVGLRSKQSALGFQAQVLQSVPGAYGNVRQAFYGIMENTQAQIGEISARRESERRSHGGSLTDEVELNYQNQLQSLGAQHLQAYNQLSTGWENRLMSTAVNAPRSASLATPFLSYRAAVGAGVRHPAMGGAGNHEYDTPLIMAMAMGHSWAGATGTPAGFMSTALTGASPIAGGSVSGMSHSQGASDGLLSQILKVLSNIDRKGSMIKDDTTRPRSTSNPLPHPSGNR